jgi:hypothetical protein
MPIWAWLVLAAGAVLLVLVGLAIAGYPDDGSF